MTPFLVFAFVLVAIHASDPHPGEGLDLLPRSLPRDASRQARVEIQHNLAAWRHYAYYKMKSICRPNVSCAAADFASCLYWTMFGGMRMQSKMAKGGEPVTFALGDDYNCSVVIAAPKIDVPKFIHSKRYKDIFVWDDLLVTGPVQLNFTCRVWLSI